MIFRCSTAALMDRDYDWLFRRNRFTGADRLGDANQLTAAADHSGD
jgi:LPS-assembly protein